jgi:glycosyltransferase involved in cell wall biosynthesis
VKSVDNAHVLFIPSWYRTRENPVHGSFIREQAVAVHRLGVKTGVVFTELRTLLGTRPWEWPARRFQIVEEDDGGIPTLRVVGWRIPAAKQITRRLAIEQTQRLVKQYVRRYGVPDLIHAHCVHDAGLAALEAKQNWRIPYVVTEHFSGYARGLMSDEKLVEARDVFLQAERIVTVSRRLAEDIGSYAGGKNIQVIPNVVDTEFFSPPAEPRRDDPFTFLFVGFLTPNKRVDDLLRAFAALVTSNDRVRLEIGGDGTHRPALEALARELGIERRVDFRGMISREQVRDAMRRANAVVSASEVETFGVVLVEGMATGLPVIVTRCGGPEEFVTDEVGRLVAVGDTAGLQNTMAEMVSDYDRWQRAAPQIRAYAVSSFSEEVVGAKLVETYNSVIQQS